MTTLDKNVQAAADLAADWANHAMARKRLRKQVNAAMHLLDSLNALEPILEVPLPAYPHEIREIEMMLAPLIKQLQVRLQKWRWMCGKGVQVAKRIYDPADMPPIQHSEHAAGR